MNRLRSWFAVVQYTVGLWTIFWTILIMGLSIYGLTHFKPPHPCYPMRGEVHACRR